MLSYGAKNMHKRRIVVTGLGVVAPNGIGKARFATALFSGQSGIRRFFSQGEPNPPCHVVAPIADNPLTMFTPRNRHTGKSMSRVSQFAVASAHMALDDAGISLEKLDPRRTGVCYGTTTGKPDFDIDAARFRESGVAGLQPTAWAEFSPHAPAAHIAREFDFSGSVATCSAGCCTGLTATDLAANRIASGRFDTILVGSADSLLSPLLLAALSAGKLLSKGFDPTKASRPYDLHRDGLVPGEAAGAIVLESYETAVERNARIYAEYGGFASTVDVHRGERNHVGQGLARAIEGALDNAGLGPNQIDCINSHGLSHPVFDLEETQGFKSGLGEAAYCLSVTSIKSMTGATFAGDGLLQIISSCLILEQGVIPPILSLETPDPACDLDYVVDKPRRARVNHILTNNRALGGTNAVLILGRVDPGR
jgi:3-oxoacyl-[acyl-carrier-protein] synthase II